MNRAIKTVAYHTLGCKLNFAETSTISRNMEHAGFDTVDFMSVADLYVINTCTVTENADRDFRKLVNRIRRRSPDARIAAVGCYAQLKPEWIRDQIGAEYILGSAEKFRLAEFIREDDDSTVFEVKEELDLDFVPAYSLGDRTRTYLKIQDGCDYPCTYCTIPLARGGSRSDEAAHILVSAEEAAEAGVQEIVLTGVNVGEFGHDNDQDLMRLLRDLDSVGGIKRYRISSIEPNLLSDEIIGFVAESRSFLPHFHVPLQSGNDRVLADMQRRYQSATYRDRVERIRSFLPDAGIGADVIVGFPGESEDDFLITYRFINELEISYLHVFTYSERPNTEAEKFGDDIPMAVKKERNRMLTILGAKKWHAFAEKNLSCVRPVLFEQMKDGHLVGHTDNYLRVHVTGGTESLLNTIQPVELTDIRDTGMAGRILK